MDVRPHEKQQQKSMNIPPHDTLQPAFKFPV